MYDNYVLSHYFLSIYVSNICKHNHLDIFCILANGHLISKTYAKMSLLNRRHGVLISPAIKHAKLCLEIGFMQAGGSNPLNSLEVLLRTAIGKRTIKEVTQTGTNSEYLFQVFLNTAEVSQVFFI